MNQVLDYASPRRRSRWLGFAATATAMYPLLFLACLYGEWYLAWLILGHQPIPSLDDPKGITGSSWLHPITGLALLGMMPAAIAALMLNLFYILDLLMQEQDRRPKRAAVQGALLLSVWCGCVLLLQMDPQPVGEWWID